MAKYNITNLNYIATGENRSFLNMDIQLGYEIYDYLHLLCAENQSSGYVSLQDKANDSISALHHDIGTEQGDGYWYPNRYIQHGESDMAPISEEKYSEAIILNEQQQHFIETDPNQKKYIRLYLSCCTNEMKQKIYEFNKNRETMNCTYLLDTLNLGAESKNNLTSNGSISKNMYDIRDVTIQKQGQHESIDPGMYGTDLHHDTYAPSMEEHPIGFCQAQLENEYLNDALVLTQNIAVGPQDLKTTLLSSRNANENDEAFWSNIESNEDTTYTYCTKEERSSFSQALQPRRNYMNIKKSYIVDMPVYSYTGNDISKYDNGQAYYLRMHTTKSAFNPLYTMEMSSTTCILNARTYCGIGVVGGKPYLKYYDDSSYKSISSNSENLDDIATIRFNSKSGSQSDNTTTPYQKIEFLYPSDYANEARHKSNVFTISILSTNIGTLASTISEKQTEQDSTQHEDELLDKLTTLSIDIAHAVRQIVECITPANTQLFDVYFKED